ncbi:hypothetical protein RUND412_002597 [Rhizina undulata]
MLSRPQPVVDKDFFWNLENAEGDGIPEGLEEMEEYDEDDEPDDDDDEDDEADEEYDGLEDGDCDFGSRCETTSVCASDTTSIQSDVVDYVYENGRRYHAFNRGRYWAPNDEKQNTQLDIFHHIYSLALHGMLYLAPIGEDPEAVLDLGTGTGVWAIDMADKFPDARVTGNDLSPIQPAWIPNNLEFVIEDFTEDWTWPEESFDFIHGRALYGSVEDWPRLISEIHTALKPGGWFESVETSCEHLSDDGSVVQSESVAVQWSRLIAEAGERIGKTFDLIGKVKPWMEEAGFVKIQEIEVKLPVGTWPRDGHMREIGKYNLVNILEAAEGFSMAMFTRVLNWDPSTTQALLEKVCEEYQDKDKHGYFRMAVVYGQKPV